MTTLVEHLETYFGEIQDGWTDPQGDAVREPFQLVRFLDRTLDCDLFSTLGLSDVILHSRRSAKAIRAELILGANVDAHVLVPILHQVAMNCANSGFAPLRGDVIGPMGPMPGAESMCALYATIPVYWPDEFSACDVDRVGDVIFVWLIPITPEEVEFIKKSGWQAFEQRLEEVDPDLMNLRRPSIC